MDEGESSRGWRGGILIDEDNDPIWKMPKSFRLLTGISGRRDGSVWGRAICLCGMWEGALLCGIAGGDVAKVCDGIMSGWFGERLGLGWRASLARRKEGGG